MNEEYIKSLCEYQISLIATKHKLMAAYGDVDRLIDKTHEEIQRLSEGGVYVTYDGKIIDEKGVLNGK